MNWRRNVTIVEYGTEEVRVRQFFTVLDGDEIVSVEEVGEKIERRGRSDEELKDEINKTVERLLKRIDEDVRVRGRRRTQTLPEF